MDVADYVIARRMNKAALALMANDVMTGSRPPDRTTALSPDPLQMSTKEGDVVMSSKRWIVYTVLFLVLLMIAGGAYYFGARPSNVWEWIVKRGK